MTSNEAYIAVPIVQHTLTKLQKRCHLYLTILKTETRLL